MMSQAGPASMSPHVSERRQNTNASPSQHLELEVPDFSQYFEEFSKRFGSGVEPKVLQNMGMAMFNFVAGKFKITMEVVFNFSWHI